MSSATLAPELAAVSSLQRSRQRMAWLLVAPALLILLAIAGLPLLRTFWMSLTDAQLADLSARQFVGLANYIGEGGVLSDPEWWGAVRNTLWFSLLSVSLETVFGLGVALIMWQIRRWVYTKCIKLLRGSKAKGLNWSLAAV